VPHDPVAGPAVVGHAPEVQHHSSTAVGLPAAQDESRPLGRPGKVLLTIAMVSGLITHAYHLFDYPLYSTDEGIYLERAWAILRIGKLSPQTYFYDHAPGGSILIAAWESVLPRQFETFGNPVNSGRLLMLILHLASVFFLFQIARRLSGGLIAPAIATFLFNFSPLAIYYQREVLLDNIMVFWLLLSIYLLLSREGRLFTGLWSGLAFGIAVVTKENAIFFAPAIFYLLSHQTRNDPNRRFAVTFWLFATSAPVLAYTLLATLKGELVPPALDFSLAHTPQGHVSLLYELWFQVHRNQGTLFAHNSFLYGVWLPKDGFLLVTGTGAMLICLYLGWHERKRDPALLVAGALAFGIAFYLARGSVILDFYVIPVIPLYALCIGLVSDRMLKRMPAPIAPFRVHIVCSFCAALLILPSASYFIVHGKLGGKVTGLQAADVYRLPLTYLQNQEIAWVRQHIPPNAKVITDDDIWVALHDMRPAYPFAQSHWNAASDPEIRKMFGNGNSLSINYIVASNQMKTAMILNNGGPGINGPEKYMLDAIDYHSTTVWKGHKGDVTLFIYKIH
jgi:4-amino-4-deoxy-L-arabinose transferase-like glycosyltransferase